MRAALVAGLASVFLGGCRAAEGRTVFTGGDAERGKQAIAGFGCGACHEIGGVPGAHGKVGPPLSGIGERSMIAGQLPNTPDNMVRWLLDPPGVEPGTAMPDLVNDEGTARDMTAYLYTLR
jgi:cytochrome c2